MQTLSLAGARGFDVACRTTMVDGVNMFYREAGPKDAPVLLLLHGFPSSSHMFRTLMTRLSDQFHLIAPDFPGFGFTIVGEDRRYPFTFEALAATLSAFVDSLGLKRYLLYIFDYGAPIGFRHAMAHPDRIVGIVSQNGNAYEEGLGEIWGPVRAYWSQPTTEHREDLMDRLTLGGILEEYLNGVSDPLSVAPEAYWLDSALMSRPGNVDIQLDLKLDYASNVALYPKFQEYFRQRKPPMLAIWGKNDRFFVPAGAYAFQKDLPETKVQLLDTGHFTLETHAGIIASEVRDFGIGVFERLA